MLLGVFVKSCIDLADPANSESGDSWFGLGPPLVIGIGFLLLGVRADAHLAAAGHREFFRRRPEVVDPAVLATPPDGTGGLRWPSRCWATTGPRARAPCCDHATALAAELGDSLVVVFADHVSRLGGEVHDYEEVLRERGRAVLEEARSIVREAGVEIEIVMREELAGRGADRGGRRARRAPDRRRLLRRAPAQERARGVDADAAAAPRPAARPRRSRTRVTPGPGAAPCAPRRGSATLLARMTFSLALRFSSSPLGGIRVAAASRKPTREKPQDEAHREDDMTMLKALTEY